MSVVSIRNKYPLPKTIWNVFFGTLSILFTFLPMMLLHLLQYPSLLLLPFSRKAYWAYNRTIAYLNWGWWAYGLQHLVGTRIEYSGVDVPHGENAIVIANHQSMADIPIMLCLALRKGRVGDLKWLVKDQLKYVPGVGWGLVLLDAIFLKRRWADDKENVANTFQRYIDMRVPIWLLLFPEGTRSNEKKLKKHMDDPASQRFSQTKFVLPPRSKGFVASVEGLRPLIDAVYDLTIIYPHGLRPTLLQVMRGETDVVRVDVRRYPIASVPVDPKVLGAWLRERYLEKDQIVQEKRMD